MTKNEVMYEYAKIEYEVSRSTKKDLRTRSATFFGIGQTIISAVAAITFSINDKPFSTLKIIFLSLSLLFFIISLIIFFLIYSPSSQLKYSPRNVVIDLRNIEDAKENEELINYALEEGKYEYISSELSLSYVAERMAEMSDMYEVKIKSLLSYFYTMSAASIISLILMVVTIVI